MTTSNFVRQQVSLSFAYLAYAGRNLLSSNPNTPATILGFIHSAMLQIPPLWDIDGNLDWRVVWGPAIYTFPFAERQDNMMFVGQQISEPDNYIIGIRGTNSDAIWDWLAEDLLVWTKVPWLTPPGVLGQGQATPMISKATQDGINVLLKKTIPAPGMPTGAGVSSGVSTGANTGIRAGASTVSTGVNITAFLTGLAASGKVNLLFTGHSLGGALAPTLALWFRQSQKIAGGWDPHGNASISTVPFAGPTAGDQNFVNFFNEQLGDACDRIYNTLDVVPHAWETETLDLIPNLYASAGIGMDLLEGAAFDIIKGTVQGYEQINGGDPMSWGIQSEATTYMQQLTLQHNNSYPDLLGVPSLKNINPG